MRYGSIAATFTDNDDSAARLATLDALTEAEANTVGTAFACPVCRNDNADSLVIHEDATTWVECLACLNVYEPDTFRQRLQDYRLDPDYDPDMETEAERVGVERY